MASIITRLSSDLEVVTTADVWEVPILHHVTSFLPVNSHDHVFKMEGARLLGVVGVHLKLIPTGHETPTTNVPPCFNTSFKKTTKYKHVPVRNHCDKTSGP